MNFSLTRAKVRVSMLSRNMSLGMERRSCSSAWQGAEERMGDEDTLASIGWSRGLLGLFGSLPYQLIGSAKI